MSLKTDRLLEAKADINAKNKMGATALMRASHYGHEEVLQILLDAVAKGELRTLVTKSKGGCLSVFTVPLLLGVCRS